MDLARFGLNRRPFRPTPDTDLYCGVDTEQSLSVALQRAFTSGQGIAVIDGDAGTGKTLLGLRFLESLPTDTRRVMVYTSPAAKACDLLQAILFDLGKQYQGMSEQELRLAVHGEVLSTLSAGGTVAILIDEAQNLTAEAIEEIRLLCNLESKSTKAVFVLLVGLPAVRELIARAAFTGFDQRVSVRGRLLPLSAEESVRFIRHQVRVCGGRPEAVMTDESLSILADSCGGIPRLINRAAGLAFEISGSAGNDIVDAEAVHEALNQLGLLRQDSDPGNVIPVHSHSDSPGSEVIPTQPIQLRRTARTTQQSPTKKSVKRKSA